MGEKQQEQHWWQQAQVLVALVVAAAAAVAVAAAGAAATATVQPALVPSCFLELVKHFHHSVYLTAAADHQQGCLVARDMKRPVCHAMAAAMLFPFMASTGPTPCTACLLQWHCVACAVPPQAAAAVQLI